MKKTIYATIEGTDIGYWSLLVWIGLFVLSGLGASWYMESNGHYVTGMTNQIVWGLPHVFAVFLIVAASGALNVASISSVFKRPLYKPLARLSAVLAVALLAGGLAVLVLDLGRPDRLIIAMTSYNFKSIFAWNIYLYTGFFGVVLVYLWFMMEHRMNRFARAAGIFAFIWRLSLTTGTGSIFGFLVARQAYNSAIMAPMFIVMSFSFGLAIYILVLFAGMNWTGRPLGDAVVKKLKNLLGVFCAVVLYFVVVQHLTNLYATERHGVEAFILRDGGIYTTLFWVVQVFLGGLVPMALVFHPATGSSRQFISLASILVILGGMAQVYVIIVGGQAYPLALFPGMDVSSSFFDGVINPYTPSLAEIVLGLGGVAITLGIVVVGLKFLPLLPASLADSVVDPHYRPSVEPDAETAADEAEKMGHTPGHAPGH